MPDANPSAPLDLSTFDDLEAPSQSSRMAEPVEARDLVPATANPALLPLVAAERLVDIDNMKPEEIEEARLMASRIDFRRTNSLLSHSGLG